MNDYWDYIAPMEEVLREAGLIVDYIKVDGKLHRCKVKGGKNGSKDGAYKAYLDDVASLWWQNWKTGQTDTWSAKVKQTYTKEERKAWKEAKERQEEQQKFYKEERQKKAASEAFELLNRLTPATAETPYLKRKGVLPFGEVRQDENGTLFLPIRNGEGELMSLQYIFGNASKQFLPGGDIKSGFFSLPAEEVYVDGPLLIAEGYATAASLHMATGYEVLVSFGTSNLCALATVAREKHPEREIIMCADNDVHEDGTENAGVRDATKAAQAIGAKLAICPPINGKKADFNDLHTATEDGLEQVKSCIENAKPVEPLKTAIPFCPSGYVIRETGDNAGLFKLIENDGYTKEIRLGPPIRFLAFARDEHSSNWSKVLEWKDPDGVQHRKAISEELLQKPSYELATMLAVDGYSIEPKMQKDFLVFLANCRTSHHIRSVSKVGWYQDKFVLPDTVIGVADGSIIYQSRKNSGNLYQTAGTLEEWKEIARLCAGNDRLTFALCAAFAGPLLTLIGLEGGGFSFEGPSSCGKTTGLQVAASVWGGPAHVRGWRTTSNALENVAVEHNDNLLVLDELSEVKGKDLYESIYMLANGVGKSRAGRGGEARPQVTWRLLFLSSGEVGIAQRFEEEGLKSRAGQEVRFVGIPVEREDLSNLHGLPSSGALVNRIKALVSQHYGHAGRFYLKWLLEDLQAIKEEAQEGITIISKALCPEGASEQIERAARRYAIVQIAGTLAKQAGILPDSIDERTAVSSCFDAWLDTRGSICPSEDDAIKSMVRGFILQYGSSRFQNIRYPNETCLNRVGFMRKQDDDTIEYIVPKDKFKDVVTGHQSNRAAKVLKAAGWLRTESDRNTVRCDLRAHGMSNKEVCYAITLPDEE